MNERIQEIALRAGLEFDDDLTLESEPIYYATRTDLGKFAELIIKDCSCVPTDMWGEGELDADLASKVHRRILNHFGVRE